MSRIEEINKYRLYGAPELTNKGRPLKISKNDGLKTALTTERKGWQSGKEISGEKSRKIINQKLLGNGFLLIEEIHQSITDSSTWRSWKRLSYEYDSNNNLVKNVKQVRINSFWLNNERRSYKYDNKNNLIEMVKQHWDDSVWVNDYRNLWSYNYNNNKLEWLDQYWDDSTWVIYWHFLYKYDEKNYLTEELKEVWRDSVWKNNAKTLYTYDSNYNLTGKDSLF